MTLVIVVVVVVVVRLGGGDRRGTCDHCCVDITSYLTETIHYFISHLFHFILFVKMTAKKAHETTTPAYPQLYAEPHQVFTFGASILLSNDDLRSGRKNVGSELFLTFSRRKKRNPTS